MSHVRSIRWKPVSLLLCFLIVVAMPLTVLVPVSAATISCSWTDISDVTCNGESFGSPQTNGTTMTLTGSANNTGSDGTQCPSDTLVIANYKGAKSAKETLITATQTGKFDSSCSGTTSPVTLSNTYNAIAAAATTNCTSGTDANGYCNASDPDTINCTSGGGFFTEVLNWILCGAINLAWGAASLMDSWIMSTLDVDATCIFDNTSNTTTAAPGCATGATHGYYVAWNSFRVLATALLVIVGLIMVVSQAIGFEALDAYTIRKVLPRLLIAIIGISLSWPLMRLVVEFFDTAGIDIREIMYAPFQQMGGTVSAGVGILSYLGIGATLFVMGPASLTFLLTAMLAAFVGFLVLVIRQIAIVMLVILAPLAIACYILPNTHRIWKLWYDNFLGLMLMFPIISALIAAGHIFSAVTVQGGPGGGVVAQAIGLMAYFAPYFMIPFAARMATGVIGNLAGFVNDRHRGAFDRLKGARGNAVQRNVANMKTGTRTNNAAINALTARATTPYLGVGRRGREAYADKMELATHDFAKSKHGMATQFKDPVLQAKTYASAAEARRRMANDFDLYKRDAAGNITNRADADRSVEEAIAGARVSGGFGGVQQVWAAKQLAATGTGYDNEAQMLATIARVSGNNAGLGDSMWGEMRGTSERAGRNDLKAGYGDGTRILENLRRENTRNGTALSGADMQRDNQRAGGFSDQLADFSFEAARGTDNMTAMGRNKPKSIGNMMRNMNQNAERYQAQLTTRQNVARNDRGKWVGTGQALSAGQEENARVKLEQIHTKMSNMRDYADYGPEVNAEFLHGERTKAPGNAPGNMSIVPGQRESGYQSGEERVRIASQGDAQGNGNVVGTPAGGSAVPEERSRRGVDPRAIQDRDRREREDQ